MEGFGASFACPVVGSTNRGSRVPRWHAYLQCDGWACPGFKGARQAQRPMPGTETMFDISQDELDGEFPASALGLGIHAQGGTIDDLRRNVREAVRCCFDDGMARPRPIRLHYARDEVLVARRPPRDAGGSALPAALRRMGCEEGASAGLARAHHGAGMRRTPRGDPTARSYAGPCGPMRAETLSSMLESIALRHGVGVRERLPRLDLR